MPPFKPYLLSRQAPCHLAFRSHSSRRHLSTSTSNPPLPPSSGYAPLPSRRLISLSGHDAFRFLNGLVSSQAPSPSTPGGHPGGHFSAFSAFLNAEGRVLYDVFIYPATHSKEYRNTILKGSDEPGFLIEVDANEVGALAKHLRRFKLRAKIEIEVMEEEKWNVWGVWPMGNQQLVNSSDIWCNDGRAPGFGYRVIRPRWKQPDGEGEVTSEQYDLRRMMMGIAEGQREIVKESALPQESNIDYMGGIDFRKGCYVGQELTIRTHHTGVVRKRILPVQIYDSGGPPPDKLSYDLNSKLALPPRGTKIYKSDKPFRGIGKWLGGVGNVGLALCRLEVMTHTVLTTEGNQFSPKHAFKMECNPQEGPKAGEVNVKAFVPSWHEERAVAQSIHRIDP